MTEYHIDGRFYALDRFCAHRAAPLVPCRPTLFLDSFRCSGNLKSAFILKSDRNLLRRCK